MLAILRLYAAFAVLSTIANIGTQMAVLHFWGDRNILLGKLIPDWPALPREGLLMSIAAGTIIGLLVKFYLDRTFIFNSVTQAKTGARLAEFALYCCTAIITTLVFWGFEIAFEQIFQTAFMRYTGAVLGLTVGYLLKFFLDWKYVFRQGLKAH